MMARDGPVTTQADIVIGTAAALRPTSRLISTPKPQSGTGSKKTRKPKSSRTKAPPKTDGYIWRKDGAGWELRKTVYVDDGTGSKVRKRPYVARMARDVFQDMKKRHKGAALEKAVRQWIADHDSSHI